MSILKFIPKKKKPLDKYKSRIQFVFSDYQLLSGNFKIEVREDDGGTKQEFNYVNGYIDKTSIQAFVGANSGYISAMWDQKTDTKVEITTESQQRQIINAGVWVTYANEYNLEIPQNTALTVSGISACNRLKNLNMCSYIAFKGNVSISGYTADYVFPIKCNAGLMDFEIMSGTNVFWYDADGNTSTDARPAPILVNSGNSYMFATNMLGNITIHGRGTSNKWVGDIKDLPRLTYQLMIADLTGFTGDIQYLPKVTDYLLFGGNNNIVGDVDNLPKNIPVLYFYNCSKLTGSVSNLSTVRITLQAWGCPLTGILNPIYNTLTYILLQNTNMSANDTDQSLINTAAVITSHNGLFKHENNRTSASDAAVATLQALGWTVVGE